MMGTAFTFPLVVFGEELLDGFSRTGIRAGAVTMTAARAPPVGA